MTGMNQTTQTSCGVYVDSPTVTGKTCVYIGGGGGGGGVGLGKRYRLCVYPDSLSGATQNSIAYRRNSVVNQFPVPFDCTNI